MKVIILLALFAVVYADLPLKYVTTTAKPDAPRPARYVLLRDGSVHDTLVDRVIPVNAQVVSERGTLGDRDVFINTVPFRTYYKTVSSPSISYLFG